MNPYYHRARLLTSAANLSQSPPDEGFEAAFAGRSNAGKSSAINALCQQKNLARTSKTPGRTQLLNFFYLDDHRRLVDLPGYGYAKVSEGIRREWQGTLADYLENRECLRGLMLMMDIRHPLKKFDVQMLEWADNIALPVHILLTKADKLKKGPAKNTLLQLRGQLASHAGMVTVQLFSALKHTGHEELVAVLNAWLTDESVLAGPEDDDLA